jgi:hypothetical protein
MYTTTVHKHSYVDYATQKRYPKASANWYTKLVKAHKDGSSSNGKKSNGKKNNGSNSKTSDSNLAGNGGTSTTAADNTENSGIYTYIFVMHVLCNVI